MEILSRIMNFVTPTCPWVGNSRSY